MNVINFSGGRTSGFMLWYLVNALKLTDCVVIFCNTGKERPETLDFVQAVSDNWQIPIVWLEYRRVQFDNLPPKEERPKGMRTGTNTYAIVEYQTASRNGEPFAAMNNLRGYLPNMFQRHCTGDLKIKPADRFLRDTFGQRTEHTKFIGIRADESHRAAKQGEGRFAFKYPFVEQNITSADVLTFWKNQPFDLQLKSYEGNCDLCFMKGMGKTRQIIRDNPELSKWWEEQEKLTGRTFHKGVMTYEEIRKWVERRPEFDFANNYESPSCYCAD